MLADFYKSHLHWIQLILLYLCVSTNLYCWEPQKIIPNKTEKILYITFPCKDNFQVCPLHHVCCTLGPQTFLSNFYKVLFSTSHFWQLLIPEASGFSCWCVPFRALICLKGRHFAVWMCLWFIICFKYVWMRVIVQLGCIFRMTFAISYVAYIPV